jgi:prepilin-type N-terminal cleavage/methylation domain-containing protein
MDSVLAAVQIRRARMDTPGPSSFIVRDRLVGIAIPHGPVDHHAIQSKSAHRAGLSLVEMLVVVAIVALLVALLLPALQAARESARRIDCANRLRQNVLSILLYADVHNESLPPIAENPAGGVVTHSWRLKTLPFVEEAALMPRIPEANRDWWKWVTELTNFDGVSIPLFQCPSRPGYYRFSEVTTLVPEPMVLGASIHDENLDFLAWAAWLPEPERPGYRHPMRAEHHALKKITDGLSRTILLFERSGFPDVYVGRPSGHPLGAYSSRKPSNDPLYNRPVEKRAAQLEAAWCFPEVDVLVHVVSPHTPEFSGLQVNKRNRYGIYSFHIGGAYVAYCDSRVRFLTEDTSPSAILAEFSARGGESSSLP